MTYRVYLTHVRRGKQGYSSAIMLQRSDLAEALGTVYWDKVFPGQGISSVTVAQRWAEANVDLLWDILHDDEDDAVIPGWARFPDTENEMYERAKKRAKWNS